MPYGTVTKGGRGGVAAKGTYLCRRREEVYHYTYVGGGCVGTTYMGTRPVGSCTLCYSWSFFKKNRVFGGSKMAKMAKIGAKMAKIGHKCPKCPKWVKMIKNALKAVKVTSPLSMLGFPLFYATFGV